MHWNESLFFLYSVLWQWFPSFCLPGHLSTLLPITNNQYLLCYWFLLDYCSYVCLYLSSSRLSVTFLHLLHSFSETMDHLTIIILNPFSGRLLISTSFSCSSEVLSCPFIWVMTLCLLINFLWCGFPSGGCWIAGFFASLSTVWWMRLTGLCKLPDEKLSGKNWLLLWWAGPGSVKR